MRQVEQEVKGGQVKLYIAKDMEAMIRETAKVCHEANRAICLAHQESMKPWEGAEDWQRRSAVDGVVFALKNPVVTAADMHENWRRDKAADGWVYGAIKDSEQKTHPCMKDFHSLLPKDQLKDGVFLAIVRAMMRGVVLYGEANFRH